MTNKTLNLTDHKQRVAAVYDLASSGYDKPAVRFFPLVAKRLVDLARIQPGAVVLDTGTGTGAAAIAAASKAGPTGRVIGVDIAADMLAQAQRKLDALRLMNVTIQYGDIERLFATGQPTADMTYRLARMMDPTLYPDPYVLPTFIDNHDVRRFLSIATGNKLAGFAGGFFDRLPLPELFGAVALTTFVAAAILLLLTKPIRRMMGGVH